MTTSYLSDTLRELRKYKKLAERALAQIDDARLLVELGPESNSLAIIMKHVAGNMRSRWTDFLTSDGEKPDRNRDTEFELPPAESAETVRARWEEGWRLLFAAVEPLTEGDLERTVTIRGEPHTVQQAIQRQLTHYAYHVGQIVYVARHLAGERWQSLSIPRGKSAEYDVAKDGGQYLVAPAAPEPGR